MPINSSCLHCMWSDRKSRLTLTRACELSFFSQGWTFARALPVWTREPHPWGATAATAPTTHARGHNTIAPSHQLPVPVPAVYARPYFCFSSIKKKKKRKLGGEEQGHNHPSHTRTAHSAHTGEQEPSGPGHCTHVGRPGDRKEPIPHGSDALGRPSRPTGPVAGAVL